MTPSDAERRHPAESPTRGHLRVVWDVIFGALRFTVIMLRMGKLLADMGFVPPEFARDNLISQGLDRLLNG